MLAQVIIPLNSLKKYKIFSCLHAKLHIGRSSVHLMCILCLKLHEIDQKRIQMCDILMAARYRHHSYIIAYF